MENTQPASVDWRALVTPGAVHEIYAASGLDAVVGNAFALGLATAAAKDRPIVWGLQDLMLQETGQPHAVGLHEMGLRPEQMLIVRTRTPQALLAVGEEALRNSSVGAVVLSAWGESQAMTLTASRRLSLAARMHGAPLFLARAGAGPAPSAAETRWSIRSAPSVPLEAEAPGHPVFHAALLRHRGGQPPQTWTLEWNREHRAFIEPAPLSGDLVPVAAERSAA